VRLICTQVHSSSYRIQTEGITETKLPIFTHNSSGISCSIVQYFFSVSKKIQLPCSGSNSKRDKKGDVNQNQACHCSGCWSPGSSAVEILVCCLTAICDIRARSVPLVQCLGPYQLSSSHVIYSHYHPGTDPVTAFLDCSTLKSKQKCILCP
jgi:hypothetical protein